MRRPKRAISEQVGNTFDAMLFYECVLADERARGTVAMPEVKDAAAPGDSPAKTNDISSGEEDFGKTDSEEKGSRGKAANNAAVSEEEDSNNTELTGSDEETDAEEHFRNANAAVFFQCDKIRDNLGTTSSKDEDSPRDIPKSEYEKLDPDTRVQEIAEVFRQAAAEVVNGAVKDALLVNAQQVLIIGSMLAEPRRKQAQAYEDKKTHLEARRKTFQARIKTLEAGNEALEGQNEILEAQIIDLQAQLQSLEVRKAASKPDVSTLSAAELVELLQSIVEALRKFLLPDQDFPNTSDQIKPSHLDTELTGAPAASNIPSRVKRPEQEKPDVGVSGVSAAEAGSDEQPEPNVDRLQLDPQLDLKTTIKGPARPSKAVDRFKKTLRKQPKGAVPSFMGTTAAAAANSRAFVSRPDVISKTKMTTHTRTPIRVTTRADFRADEQAVTRAGT